MAMLHPSDMTFSQSDPVSVTTISTLCQQHLGLAVESIESPSTSQGSYHKVYFVKLSDGSAQDGKSSKWSGKEVVLRVARKTIRTIKILNEVAVIDVVRRAGIPAPELVFYNSDPANETGFEYICVERIPFPSLSDTWTTSPPEVLDKILDQMIDFFAAMFDMEVPGGGMLGGLQMNDEGRISPGPVLEETMWQLPDIARYFYSEPYNLSPTIVTFATLNPGGPYPTWVAYISAFLKSCHFVISIHPSVSHLVHLLGPLQKLINKLDDESASQEDWVRRLKTEKGLRGRLWHRDLHFGNLLADDQGTIKGVIDWEFAGVGPSFHKTSSPIRNSMYFAFDQTDPAPPQTHLDIMQSWPAEFVRRLEIRAPAIAAAWAYESDPDRVLGSEGRALSDLREFLRSCLEVGVRGWGNVEMGKGAWRMVVEEKLKVVGCL